MMALLSSTGLDAGAIYRSWWLPLYVVDGIVLEVSSMSIA